MAGTEEKPMSDGMVRVDRGTREGRRRELIEAASGVIAEHGLAGTTLARVAAEAGLSAGIVNHHFATKDALLLETLRTLSEEFGRRLEKVLSAAGDDAVAGLRGLILLHFDRDLANTRHVAVWYAFQSEARWRASYTTLCGEHDRFYMAAVRDLVGAVGGPKCDSDVLARSLVGLLDSYWQDILFDEPAFDRPAAVAACLRFLAAILPGFPVEPPAPKPAAKIVAFPGGETTDGVAHKPAGPPETLPSWTYVSEEFFALERQEIFLKEWHIVCHVSQLQNPGDYRSFALLGERAFVMRGKDGVVRGFNNVCRHRAHAVVTGEGGNCPGAIVCPYHGWSYKLDGALNTVAAPHSFAEFERLDYGLFGVETEVFMGFVFIRFGGEGPSVAERLAPYAEELKVYRFEELVPASDLSFQENHADWKTVWDNYLEGYHFAKGHPELYSLMGNRYDLAADPARRVARLGHSLRQKAGTSWSGRMYQSLRRRPEHLPEDMRENWTYFFLFPLLAFDVYPEMIGHFQVLPTGPGSSQLRYQNFCLPEQLEGRQARAERWLNARINNRVQGEDDALVTSVQGGLSSSAYSVGVLSEKEVIVHNFQNWVRDRLPVARILRRPEPGTMAALNRDLLAHRLN
jgi:phenylpropionate dioxygenase-like ring-hydroxylating dioxygenase large terminal subunit/AcrR family transcriptional regulator